MEVNVRRVASKISSARIFRSARTRRSLAFAVLVSVMLSSHYVWAAALELYETGAPDLGTASAGRAAMASDASTTASNPAGMTLLDRSHLLGSAGTLLPST